MLQEALGQFRSLRIAGRIRGVMRLLPDNVLYSLLQKLSSANMPAELLRMLNAMHVDGRRMPAVDESTTDNAASSLLTSWLAGTRSTASQKFEGAARCSDMQVCLFIQWPWLQACLINENMLTTAWHTLQMLGCLVGKENCCDGAWYCVLTRQQTTKHAAVGVALGLAWVGHPY